MPFDEEEDVPTIQSQKIGLKQVSSQKSIFETMPKKPTQEEFTQQVKKVQERMSAYKARTTELAIQFNKAMADKTLPVNKNMFQKEMELEILRNMVKLAQDINSDVKEREGEGSLSWITLLLKTSFNRRDKINNLEFALQQLEKKIDALDKKKNSE
jgi:hypothetical protein